MVQFRILLVFLLSFCVSMAAAQQYTPMTAAGYAMKRVKVDSTLHLPSFCGVPTLRNSTAINGALAMDTCNNKLYKWTNQSGWSVVGQLLDTSLYVKYTDTATMLSKYLRKSDTASLSNRIDLKVNIADTASMLTPYLRKVDTTSLSNRINLKVNIADTASMLTPYFNKVNYGLSKSGQTISADSATLSLKYLRIVDTANKWVASVTGLNDSTIRVIKDGTTNDIVIRSSATVTSATRLITQVYNNSGSTITKGSVIYINGRHSSNLPTIALAQANTEANSYSTFALVLDDIATSNSGTVVQAGSITNLNLPTSSFTDGELVYLSPTVPGGLTTTKPLASFHIVKIGTITRAHPTFGTIELKIENGWQLDELSDVQIPLVPDDSTLLQFSRVDSLWHSVSVNNAIGTKYIKPSDTTAMLSPYARTNALALKVNISDTATMLSPYQRANNAVTLSTTQTITGQKTFNPSVTASSLIARGTYFTPTLTAAANNDTLVGLDIKPTFTNGAFTGVSNYGLKIQGGSIAGNNGGQIFLKSSDGTTGVVFGTQGGGWNALGLWGQGRYTISSTPDFRIFGTGFININTSLGINTTTDAGYKLDVNGTARVQGALTTTGSITAASAIARGSYFNQTLVAAANNDNLIGLDIAPTFTNGAFTGVKNIGLRCISGSILLGTSTSPNTGASLQIVQTGNAGTANGLYIGQSNAPAYGFGIGVDNTGDGRTNFYGYNNGTPTVAFSINRTGGFAFGSATPSTTNISFPASITINDGYVYQLRNLAPFYLGYTSANETVRLSTQDDATDRYVTLGATTTGSVYTSVLSMYNQGKNIGIGILKPATSSVLDVTSTTKGFLPPRMTTTQRTAIASPAEGLIVYDLTLHKLYIFTTAWEMITSL